MFSIYCDCSQPGHGQVHKSGRGLQYFGSNRGKWRAFGQYLWLRPRINADEVAAAAFVLSNRSASPCLFA